MAHSFFKDDGFDFEAQNLLGAVVSGGADAGEVLATIDTIDDGDAESWVSAWTATADRIAHIARDCETQGHPVSAREAWIRAAVYYAAALGMIDGVDDAEARLTSVFHAHREAFDAHVDLLDTPPERVEIPYEGSTMPGYLFSPAGTQGVALPTIVLNNGSDGPVTALWPGLGTAAVRRGYRALVFDGPGQQSLLFERGVPFRPDWEAVITPVVDFLLGRDDVDGSRLALYGISQAGYWVPRALAFEHRFAAAIADPGVMDVSTSWLRRLPKELIDVLDHGDKATFDQLMEIGMAGASPQLRQELTWRAKPYGTESQFDTFTAVRRYALGDLAGKITTPLLVTDPDNEQFWPGQPQELYDALPGPKSIVHFTAAEGADRHCEPMARQLLAQRLFDWVDDTLGRSTTTRPTAASAS